MRLAAGIINPNVASYAHDWILGILLGGICGTAFLGLEAISPNGEGGELAHPEPVSLNSPFREVQKWKFQK
jgi:hypothetical protein